MNIYRRFYDMIEKGEKTIEVRVAYSGMRKIREGDTIRFLTKGKSCDRKVIRVTEYTSFDAMMEHEDANKINPHATVEEQLAEIKKIFPPSKEKLGVLIFELAEE